MKGLVIIVTDDEYKKIRKNAMEFRESVGDVECVKMNRDGTVKTSRIAAVVVTFNRKEMLIENIRMLLSQTAKVDSIIVVDNHSTDGTYQEVCDVFCTDISKIDYYYLNQNLGGAGGFEFGVRTAFYYGYDLIWLMDDDGHPIDTDTLQHIINKIYSLGLGHKLFVLNSLVLADESHVSFSNLGTRDLKMLENEFKNGILHDDDKMLVLPFNGTMISKELVQEIGFPNADLVINGDEWDYINRAKRAGAYIATVTDSLYYHPSAPNGVKVLGEETPIFLAKWKYYYYCRNYVYRIRWGGGGEESGCKHFESNQAFDKKYNRDYV